MFRQLYSHHQADRKNENCKHFLVIIIFAISLIMNTYYPKHVADYIRLKKRRVWTEYISHTLPLYGKNSTHTLTRN
jgi:hypothetical protein